MDELTNPAFDVAAFLAGSGVGELSIKSRKGSFFAGGIPRTLSFIFRKAAQRSLSFRQPIPRELLALSRSTNRKAQ